MAKLLPIDCVIERRRNLHAEDTRMRLALNDGLQKVRTEDAREDALCPDEPNRVPSARDCEHRLVVRLVVRREKLVAVQDTESKRHLID